jgi:predicted nucleic acid-binding protein
VVLEELYAGTADRDRQVVERLERDFDRAKRIPVPNLSDWTQAGRVLARLAAKYHYEKIGQGRLTNDALIAMSAGRLGIRVITVNRGLPSFAPSSGKSPHFNIRQAPEILA